MRKELAWSNHNPQTWILIPFLAIKEYFIYFLKEGMELHLNKE